MRAAYYVGQGTLQIQEVPTPSIGPGEVLLKVHACGICGTDVGKVRYAKVEPPIVLGHEIAGEVVQVGAGVEKFHIGDRVVVVHHIPCFVCKYCASGHHSLCPVFKVNNLDPGGFSEYVRVLPPSVEKGMYHIGEHISWEEATLIEPLACCIRAQKAAGIACGATLMVVGMGPVGLLHLQLAKFLGVKRAIALDIIDQRLQAARNLGADVIINTRGMSAEQLQEQLESPPDVAIVCAGGSTPLEMAIGCMYGGVIILFADSPPGDYARVDPNIIYHQELTIMGCYSSTPAEQQLALELIRDGFIDVRAIITHTFPLEHIQHAFELAMSPVDSLKIIIKPWSD